MHQYVRILHHTQFKKSKRDCHCQIVFLEETVVVQNSKRLFLQMGRKNGLKSVVVQLLHVPFCKCLKTVSRKRIDEIAWPKLGNTLLLNYYPIQ